jgi:hypothetical protein
MECVAQVLLLLATGEAIKRQGGGPSMIDDHPQCVAEMFSD